MSRGFGKYRRGASHHSFHFDSLFKENSNRPSAARSAASVGKWGITSFTSIRTLNGRPENETSKSESAPKPKKFFKSRDTSQDANTTPAYQSPPTKYGASSKRDRSASYEPIEKPTKGRPQRKFFSSKKPKEKRLPEKQLSMGSPPAKRRNSERSDSSESSKPPIVLRICRGKSQLVNDTDETEKTVTPSPRSVTPVSASPHTLCETSNPQTTPPRPSNCRITRSARRSMQMDPDSSPATADTPGEFTLFGASSKKDIPETDLSPQYVPAEKFEEQRRALYASLLKPDSPKLQSEEESEDELSKEENCEPKDEEKSAKDEVPETHQEATEENDSLEEPKQDTSTEDTSIEDVMAALHGGENEVISEPKLVIEENDSSMGLDQVDSGEKSIESDTEEESIEAKLARMEQEASKGNESMETIENIAKEIECSQVIKPEPAKRATRRRGKQKEQIIEPLKEKKVARPPLRGGLRNRNKAAIVEVAKEETEPVIEEMEEEPKVEEMPAIEEPEPIVIKMKDISPTPSPPPEENLNKKVNKQSIEEDWSTDSDSNNSAPDIELKEVDPDVADSPSNIVRHRDKILDKILEKPPDPPPVKLVISKKKGSIFKSRAVDDGAKKRRARYVHKWIDDGKGGGETPARPPPENTGLEEYSFDDEPLTRVKTVEDDQEVTSVKCSKTDKQYYMVVRNVKKAHQIQEIGEFQEFNDDVEYILDALQDNNPVSTRCLSAITLASKCMAPAFRMHVRAHGTVAKFFKALHDACRDQSLGLCTATVMFVLSQDRLNMDLDRDCLELMLNLLESDVSYQQALDVCGLTSGQLEKNKQKVRELCEEIQSKGHAMHLNLENITTGQLAMETLLSLTSKRAGEWFKEELRELGGLEHIMKTIHECCRQVSDYVVSWTDALLDKLKKVDRCLRVLENITQNNEENQTYILKYNEGMMIDTLVSLYKLCDGEIPLYPVTDIADKSSTGTIVREALLVTLKVLINLTHHYRQQSIGSQLVGSRSGIIETSLHLLLQVPNYIPEQKKFELGVLVLMLLINLIQDQEANKKLLMEAKAPSKLESIYSREESAVEALIIQFYEWESCAKIAENKTNAILDGEKDEQDQEAPVQPQPKTNEEFIEETVAKLLQKAGTHMEYTFLASYIVMLVGFLIMDSSEHQDNIRQFLRGNNFSDMVELLKKFFNFMNLTASTEASSVCAVKATQKVIKFLESCDQQPSDGNVSSDVEKSKIEPVDMVVPYL
ncbi:unnamed protein product [Ceutorhynchus assimilis]|uniref:WAPL domain-containing protein n=1 Tax=Ceutorhynchus assimilis TaxID=467358 RepID=A0A9N9MNJ3_9CUCU|nr:unnamed protein product [Ceutorhynchus assimilis]